MSEVLAPGAGLDTFLPHAEALARGAAAPAFVARLRADGREGFERLGLPTTEEEDWRYTNVQPLGRIPFRPGHSGSAPPATHSFASCPRTGLRMVFAGGRFDAGTSALGQLPPGVRLGSLAALLRESPDVLEPHLGRVATPRNGFVALNSAMLEEGAVLVVPPRTVMEEPLHIVFQGSPWAVPVASHPRILLVLGEASQAMVVESYAGPEGTVSLTNSVTEIVLGRGAVLDYTRVQEEARSASHISSTFAHLTNDSHLSTHLFSLGAGLARNEMTVLVDGEGAGCSLRGLYAVNGRQHVDNHTLIDHLKPHGSSQELYKGILDGQARGVFDGQIIVRPNASKTDAHQTNKNLILSNSALADSKPQLEIHNNDVRCTHGSTTGRLDPDAFFYLRSRGLDPAAARSLLTYGFASELVAKLKPAALRAYLEAWLLSWIPREDS